MTSYLNSSKKFRNSRLIGYKYWSPQFSRFLKWQIQVLRCSKLQILWSSVTMYKTYRQLRARRALLQIKDVPLRTRRALLPLTLYSNSALLVLNGTSLSCNNALLALNWRYDKAIINCETMATEACANTANRFDPHFRHMHSLVYWFCFVLFYF